MKHKMLAQNHYYKNTLNMFVDLICIWLQYNVPPSFQVLVCVAIKFQFINHVNWATWSPATTNISPVHPKVT